MLLFSEIKALMAEKRAKETDRLTHGKVRAIARRLERALQGIGAKIQLHDFRHSRATILAKEVTPFQLQKFLGHANLRTTGIYVHSNI